jgi:hypothetical protein
MSISAPSVQAPEANGKNTKLARLHGVLEAIRFGRTDAAQRGPDAGYACLSYVGFVLVPDLREGDIAGAVVANGMLAANRNLGRTTRKQTAAVMTMMRTRFDGLLAPPKDRCPAIGRAWDSSSSSRSRWPLPNIEQT